jgi:predicted lipid-binding transport protein (Tim44 family)
LVFPAGFNEKEFLDGAKRAHELLQKAWDNGELADLREFTTDKVFGEVQDQYRARSGENRTEISDVRAELLDVKDIDGKLEASVLFDCSMAEYDANSPVLVNSERVREVWHFVRAKTSLRPTWLLDGIQQVVE